MGAPGFMGRARELDALRHALSAPPALILIEGEAGIGKSRLLHELLAVTDGKHALVAECPPFREPHTLGPVTDALRQQITDLSAVALSPLAGALRPLFPEWAGQLPDALDPAEDTSAARHRVFRALTELLASVEVGLMAVEDVHWADEATLEFLLYLAARRPQPLSLVVSYRPEDITAHSAVRRLASRPGADGSRLRLELGPLSVDDTGALMSSMLAGQHVSQEFATFVHQHTEGVPLAVEESVRLMGEREDLSQDAGEWVRRDLAEIDVPPSIRDSVLERTYRLPAAAQTVLQAAAVLAEPAGEDLLTTVSGLEPDQVRDGLSVALTYSLLAEDSRGLVSFRHMLAQRAVYEATPPPQRRVMHRRAGVALESAPPHGSMATRLARHFREGGDPVRWRAYGIRAADLAATAGDEVTAAILLRDLIDTVPSAEIFRLLDKITFASDPNLDTHAAVVVRALRNALDHNHMEPGEAAIARFQLGRFLGLMSDYGSCRANLELAIPHLEDPASATWAMLTLGWPHDFASPASVHLRWLRRAALIPGSLEPAVRTRVRNSRIVALLLLGDQAGWREAEQLPADEPTAVERRALTIAKLNIGDMAIMWGKYADADRVLTEASRLAETHGYLRLRELIVTNQDQLRWFTGQWAGLRERLEQALEASDTLPVTLDSVQVLAQLDAANGRQAKAADGLRAVLAETRRRSEVWNMMEPAAALARLHLESGEADAAVQVTDEPAAILASKGIWLWATEMAPARVAALAAAGRDGEAAEVVAAFGRWMRGRDIPAPYAGLSLSRAILARSRGQFSRAARLFEHAAQAWQALPRPYDALLATESRARCLLSDGRDQEGIDLLARAAEGLASLGAHNDTLRLTDTLRTHGVEIKRDRPGRPAYGGMLSPRELDVVTLLVDGTTNRDIAQRLFLSPKTVARHIESAMRKLGVTTRTALAVRLVERGIVPSRD